MYRIKIDKADPDTSKLADVAIEFTEDAGALAGLTLIGFAIWEARTPNARRNVTHPARTYSVHGERRSFALLRPIYRERTEGPDPTEALRAAIVAEYERQEAATRAPLAGVTTLTAAGAARLEF